MDFAFSFIDFVNKLLINNGLDCTMDHLAEVIHRNFIDDLSLPCINKENNKDFHQKPVLQFLKSKTNLVY